MKKFHVDYIGTLTERELKYWGFTKFQKEQIMDLLVNETVTFSSSDVTFDVKRLE